MRIFIIDHKYLVETINGEKIFNIKRIGYYSSMSKVKEILKKYKKIKGFRDHKKGFIVHEIKLDKEKCKLINGSIVFYIVWYECDHENHYETTVVGYYEEYHIAIQSLRNIQKETYGVSEYYLDECWLDKSDWKEGFVEL